MRSYWATSSAGSSATYVQWAHVQRYGPCEQASCRLYSPCAGFAVNAVFHVPPPARHMVHCIMRSLIYLPWNWMQMSHRLGRPVMVGQFHEWQTAVGLILLRTRHIPVGMCAGSTPLLWPGYGWQSSRFGAADRSVNWVKTIWVSQAPNKVHKPTTTYTFQRRCSPRTQRCSGGISARGRPTSTTTSPTSTATTRCEYKRHLLPSFFSGLKHSLLWALVLVSVSTSG
jgi:hypothetical protein